VAVAAHTLFSNQSLINGGDQKPESGPEILSPEMSRDHAKHLPSVVAIVS
jgi:hypothetical protein